MRYFRYDTSKKWFKGNTHLHSLASDGGKDFPELADMYASAGYDFLFRTDHWVASELENDQAAYPLRWLDGIELDGLDPTGSLFHVVCLGTVKDLAPEMGLLAAMDSAREQGAQLILAHPHWSGNSLEDCLRYPFDGVEVYNHVCHWLNGKGGGLVHWDAVLDQHPGIPAFAVDDAHIQPLHPGWNGGWIVVNAAKCERQDILAAIRSGNYYSSCGPEIHSLSYDGREVHLTTSPVAFARIVGPDNLGSRVGSFDGKLITEASLPVPENWAYAYVEIEDQVRRRAWTNTLFTAG